MTQVILLKDIPKLGQKGSVKEVKDGYFRNFLLPGGLAQLATPKKIKELEEKIKSREKEREEVKKEALHKLREAAKRGLVFEAEANEKGHLFKGISAKEIALSLQIPVDWVLLEKPIKELGEYSFEVKVPPSADAHDRHTLKLAVKAATAAG